jgi:hypothetical protein
MFIAEPFERLSLATLLVVSGCFGQLIGSWKLNAARSTFAGDIRPKSLTVRIEPRARGEVVTLDRTEVNGQTTSSSMVLYLDGVARDFQQGECSGTQTSRRIDSQTVEILRNCGAGAWTRLVRRTVPKNELVLEISEQRADGRRFDRRLVFEKQ